jgi:positive regulator of sigma E activity
LSFGIGIALVPLVIFLLNRHFHMKITAFNSLATIIALTFLALVILLVKNLTKRED